jgi:hypothetical protein
LLEVCHKLNNKPQASRNGKSAKACLEEEHPYLLPLPPMFDAAVQNYYRTGKAIIVIYSIFLALQSAMSLIMKMMNVTR